MAVQNVNGYHHFQEQFGHIKLKMLISKDPGIPLLIYTLETLSHLHRESHTEMITSASIVK